MDQNIHYSQKNHCNDNCNDFSDYNDIIASLDKLIMLHYNGNISKILNVREGRVKLTYKASRCQNNQQPPQGRAGWTPEVSRCPSPREPENRSEELQMLSGSSSRGSRSRRGPY